MNKKFSYILISLFMLGFLLAPISPLIQIKNAELAIKIETSSVQAQSVAGAPAGGVITACNVGQTKDANGNCVSTTDPVTGTDSTVKSSTDTNLYNNLGDCGVFGSASVTGCFVVLMYYMFVSVPSWFMAMTAGFFDFMASLTISSNMYSQSFIQTIWQIIRDFANIFFILILLYAAFQVILGLGGGGKKIVAMVILIALLVNFSLFFTKVIIDSSNVLALIFYNKIDCTTDKGAACGSQQISDASKTGIQPKDLAVALASSFNVNSFFNNDFLKTLPQDDNTFLWIPTGSTHLQPSTAIALILTYGLVAYALDIIFLMVGLAFLGRMLTLILLLVVSPLAFVTATVPKFRSINTIGFDSWLKQLISTSFMATIFMALLYIVSEILHAGIFTAGNFALPNSAQGVVGRLLLIFIPALLIVLFLWKGMKFAVKASGEFTGLVMAGATMAGGAAIGLATGGAALALSSTVGAGARNIANSDELKAKAAAGDRGAQRKLTLANSVSKYSFDARKTGLGNLASKKSGMDFQSGASMVGLGSDKFKGGAVAKAKRVEDKEIAKEKSYELSKDGTRKQNARHDEYENDKKLAESKNGTVDSVAKEKYEKEYEDKLKNWKEKEGVNQNDTSYDKAFRKKHEEDVPPPIAYAYNEAQFKEAYKKGDTEALKSFGVDKEKEYEGTSKKFKSGGVGNAQTENKERKIAYAKSLEDKVSKDGERTRMRTYLQDFKEGSMHMVSTPGGLATTAAIGAMTGGIGAAVAVPMAGILNVLKTMVGARGPTSTSRETIAAVYQGEDPNKKLYEAIKSGKLSQEQVGQIAGKLKPSENHSASNEDSKNKNTSNEH